MLVSISWFLVLAVIAAWSAGVWALHVLVVWSLSGAGALAGPSQKLEILALPPWIEVWLPAEGWLAFQSAVKAFLPWVESALTALPQAVAWLSPLAWLVWGIGFLILLGGGAVVHGLIALTRRAALR
jgi:hypothetical protein